MKTIKFPKNPYPGQVYWDMKSKIVFEYWTPDEFCKGAGLNQNGLQKVLRQNVLQCYFQKKEKKNTLLITS